MIIVKETSMRSLTNISSVLIRTGDPQRRRRFSLIYMDPPDINLIDRTYQQSTTVRSSTNSEATPYTGSALCGHLHEKDIETHRR